MKRIFLIAVLILIGFVFVFLNYHYRTSSDVFVIVEFPNGEELNLKKVVSSEDIVKGLSHVEVLSDYDGMLFEFEKPMEVSFWMNDMMFPLDILYLDEDKAVKEIYKDRQPCDEDGISDCPKYKSRTDSIKYAIELMAGSSENYQIEIDKKIKW